MMEDLCSWSLLEFCDKTLVHENVHQELAEMRIPNLIHEVQKFLKHFFYIFSSPGEIVGKINFFISTLSQLVDCQLRFVSKDLDDSFDLNEIISINGGLGLLNVLPHLGVQIATVVTQDER